MKATTMLTMFWQSFVVVVNTARWALPVPRHRLLKVKANQKGKVVNEHLEIHAGSFAKRSLLAFRPRSTKDKGNARIANPSEMKRDTTRSSHRRNDLVSGTQSLNIASDDELRKINDSIQQIIESQQNQQSDAKAVEEANDRLFRHISSNREEMSHIRKDIQYLQSSVTCAERHVEDASKSVEMLVKTVLRGQQDLELTSNGLKVMAEELKVNNAEHKESLLNLKVSVFDYS